MKGKIWRYLAIVAVFALVSVAGFFGWQYFTKTGIFRPGELILSADLNPDASGFLTEHLASLELKEDLEISLIEQGVTPQPDELVFNILVPTSDFYTSTNSVETTDSAQIEWISALDLTNERKLLAYQGHYYLDDFTTGARFQTFKITGTNPEDIAAVTERIRTHLPHFPTKDTVLTFAQTGVTALSRGMNAKLGQVGNATYFAEQVKDFLSSFDLTHTSNEASFSPAASSANICALPAMVDVLTAIGLDIVELTGNHNQDCGDQDALDTLATYQKLGIKTVGGGASATAAATPLVVEQEGNQLTLLAYNFSTGGYTLDDTPGANFYTEADAVAQIAAAKARGDTVIVDIQFYECNSYDNPVEDATCDRANSSAGDQIGFFRHLIDLGADVVIGTSAHQPQTYELYGNGAIYYGLGNLFFDQAWWPGTTRSLVLVHYFWQNQLIQTRIVPTVYDQTLQTRLLDDATTTWFLNRLISVSPRGK